MFDGKMKALTFSYDDGVTQDIRFIELLDKYGLKATFNINSELLGKSGTVINGTIDHTKVPADKVREIYKNHEVAVHTLTHPRLTELESEEIIRQVEQDRINLSKLAGYEVIGMAYPCGGENNNDEVAEIIKENTGVKYSRTIKSTENFEPQQNLFRFNPSIYHLFWDDMMRMGKEFVEMKTDKPQIFYVWGHTYELDIDPDNWSKIEDFMRLVSGKDDIFYGTNREVLLK